MATSAFRYQGTGRFSRSHAAGFSVYLRSDTAADTGTARVYGVETTSGDLEQDVLTALTLGGKVERETGTLFDSVAHIILPASHAGTVKVFSSNGTAASGDIRFDSNPSDSDTIDIGVTGFAQTYTFKNTLASADDVKIGATAADTADNLKRAINDDGVAGTNYGTSTVANSYVSATVDGSTVTITDLLPCSRLLGWDVSESGSNFTIRTPVGGVDGSQLASIATGTDEVSSATGLVLEDLAVAPPTTDSVPAGITGGTQAIQVRGRFTIWIRVGTIPGGDVALKYQTSADGTAWRDGDSSISNFGTDADQVITPTEHAEFVRLNLTSNTLTGGTPADLRVVY